MNKRYWLFAGENCYPSGGMNDFQESFDTRDQAYHYWLGFKAKDFGGMWAHIYDSQDNDTEHL
jgi:hypothetical protein